MDYTFVSADCHMDLSWLPGDLFTSNAPAHLVDRVPRVVESPTKESKYGLYHGVWVADGSELGVYGGMGFGFTPPERGVSARTDRMWDAGYYDGDPHVIDPEQRARDLDLDGVQAELIYGMTGAGMKIKDPEVLTATYRIYNDYIADFCSHKPGRFYALACIPVHEPHAAAEELRRAAALGPLRGCDLIAQRGVASHLHSRRLLGPAMGGCCGDPHAHLLPPGRRSHTGAAAPRRGHGAGQPGGGDGQRTRTNWPTRGRGCRWGSSPAPSGWRESS